MRQWQGKTRESGGKTNEQKEGQERFDTNCCGCHRGARGPVSRPAPHQDSLPCLCGNLPTYVVPSNSKTCSLSVNFSTLHKKLNCGRTKVPSVFLSHHLGRKGSFCLPWWEGHGVGVGVVAGCRVLTLPPCAPHTRRQHTPLLPRLTSHVLTSRLSDDISKI